MLQGLAIPEEYGGQGFTFIELGIVLEEMGRVLLCAPYFSSVVLAADAILERRHRRPEAGAAAGHRERRHDRDAGVHRAVGQVGRGRHHDGSERERRRRVHADRREDVRDRRLHRRPDRRRRPRSRARPAPTASRSSRSPVTPRASPARRSRRWTRRASRRSSSSTTSRPTPLGSTHDGFAAFSKTLDQAAVALSNEMMGGAQKVLEMSVEYAKVRVQFGRPIGSFQAIKHKCADMLLEVESGKSAAYYASWAAAEDNDELPVVAALVEGVLLGGVLPRRGREHPDPRWHRLHVGAPRAPVLQAREELRDLPRRPDVPPRAARAAHRHLITRHPIAPTSDT